MVKKALWKSARSAITPRITGTEGRMVVLKSEEREDNKPFFLLKRSQIGSVKKASKRICLVFHGTGHIHFLCRSTIRLNQSLSSSITSILGVLAKRKSSPLPDLPKPSSIFK